MPIDRVKNSVSSTKQARVVMLRLPWRARESITIVQTKQRHENQEETDRNELLLCMRLMSLNINIKRDY